jgi:L-lysine 2,3-aminomutase
MIPVSSATLDTIAPSNSEFWQKAMAQCFRSVPELLKHLNLVEEQLPYAVDSQNAFRTKVTRYFADLINPKDPYDPILLQILPRLDEKAEIKGFSVDPLEEADHSPLPGLIHKYQNRVLLIAHQACAIHCRYCFRRHFPYSEQSLRGHALDKVLDYIVKDPQINEVILSGGDPLSLGDSQLLELLTRLDSLPNIKKIRIHSRTPIVLPQRITTTLANHFGNLKAKVVLVIHCNHPNEITSVLAEHLQTLRQNNVHLLNQSVLLQGINDNTDTLVALSNQLFAVGVLPYYLHLLDPVQGAQHFYLDDNQAVNIWRDMQSQLSGYLLPRLVREVPNRPSKTWVNYL